MAIYLTIIIPNVSTVFVPKVNIIAGYHGSCHDRGQTRYDVRF
jgi:hypothetical protein